MDLASNANLGCTSNMGDSSYINDTLKRRGENWTHEETVLVIKLWRDHVDELRSSKRNYHVYQRIAEFLRDKGSTRTAAEVKTKIMNLTARYRKVKLEQQQTGSNPSAMWRFFKDIHDIIGDIPFGDSCAMNDSMSDIIILPDKGDHQNVGSSPAQSNASSGSGNLQIVEPSPGKMWVLDGDNADAVSNHFNPSSPPTWPRSGRKRTSSYEPSNSLEEEKVRCLREIADEQKRCSAAVERLSNSASEMIKEMLTLHRQSFAIQGRMMDILERLIERPNELRNNSYT